MGAISPYLIYAPRPFTSKYAAYSWSRMRSGLDQPDNLKAIVGRIPRVVLIEG